MNSRSNVVDITVYQSAPESEPEPSIVGERTPLRYAGWVISAFSAAFLVFVAYQSARLGIFDAVVAGTLTFGVLMFAGGLGVAHVSEHIHARLRQRKLRLADESADVAGADGVVFIEDFRQRRSPVGAETKVTCRACGETYAVESGIEVCPACGRSSRAV